MANWRLVRYDTSIDPGLTNPYVIASANSTGGQIVMTVIDTPATISNYTYRLEVQGNAGVGDFGAYSSLTSLSGLKVKA